MSSLCKKIVSFVEERSLFCKEVVTRTEKVSFASEEERPFGNGQSVRNKGTALVCAEVTCALQTSVWLIKNGLD